MKAICHIGTPKTASTFLQNTCAANRPWLLNHGILYPNMLMSSANHMTLFFASAAYIHNFARNYGILTLADAARFRQRLSAHIREQVEQHQDKAHTILFSTENLTGNMSGQRGVGNFASFIKDIFDEVEIVIYLRRQDDSLLSMYGEFLKRGYAAPDIDSFITSALQDRKMVPYIFYRHIFRLWEKEFGRDRIKVRIFDRDSLIGGDILNDFLDIIFKGKTPDISDLPRSEDDNAGLSAPALEFMRRIHSYIPLYRDGKLNQTRQRLQERIGRLPTQPRPRMSKKQSDHIMNYFAKDNEWVRTSYFPDRPAPLFPQRDREETSGNLGKVSFDEFVELTGLLLK